MAKATKPPKTYSLTRPHVAKVNTKTGQTTKIVKGSFRRLNTKPKVK